MTSTTSASEPTAITRPRPAREERGRAAGVAEPGGGGGGAAGGGGGLVGGTWFPFAARAGGGRGDPDGGRGGTPGDCRVGDLAEACDQLDPLGRGERRGGRAGGVCAHSGGRAE